MLQTMEARTGGTPKTLFCLVFSLKKPKILLAGPALEKSELELNILTSSRRYIRTAPDTLSDRSLGLMNEVLGLFNDNS